MEVLALAVFAILSSGVFCDELPENKRDKKDIGKLENLSLGKYNKGNFYPSGSAGYLPPSYNYDYNYERRPYYPTPQYPTPQCDCRSQPPPRCDYPIPQRNYNPFPSRTYGPTAPRPIPTGPVDDTVVIYPAIQTSISTQPNLNAVAPVIRTPPKLTYDSGYNYDRPSVPF